MLHLRFWGAALLVVLSACGGNEHAADSPAAASMSPADAREFIAQIQRERGMAIDRTPVTSMEQLFDAIGDDQVGRFASAEQLVAGKPGIDALSLHATIELAWSDDFITFARILDELQKHAAFEVKRLSTKRESGASLTEAEGQNLEQNKKNAAFDAKAKLALDVLAQEHLQIAISVVDQAVRQFPRELPTYRVAAYSALLSREWPIFDTAMSWFEGVERKDAGLVYLRALEALNRRRVPMDATALLREALRLHPKMVRAQAKLVLAEDGIDARYREFENLRAVAPQHPMVALLGQSITSDYQLSSSFRDAQAARQAPAAIGTGTLQNPPNPPDPPNAPDAH